MEKRPDKDWSLTDCIFAFRYSLFIFHHFFLRVIEA
jgi:hypothetical protein